MEWLDWRDREGTPVKQGDWITNKDPNFHAPTHRKR